MTGERLSYLILLTLNSIILEPTGAPLEFVGRTTDCGVRGRSSSWFSNRGPPEQHQTAEARVSRGSQVTAQFYEWWLAALSSVIPDYAYSVLLYDNCRERSTHGYSSKRIFQ